MLICMCIDRTPLTAGPVVVELTTMLNHD